MLSKRQEVLTVLSAVLLSLWSARPVEMINNKRGKIVVKSKNLTAFIAKKYFKSNYQSWRKKHLKHGLFKSFLKFTPVMHDYSPLIVQNMRTLIYTPSAQNLKNADLVRLT